MRPIVLRLKGFTSFREEQEIDFRELDLFVLWGPTGSGKSSLLDAMTYALYGEVERVGNQTSQLISQGQPRMAVTLDFSVGGHSFRVTRSAEIRDGRTITKVRLERLQHGEWITFGPDSDKVGTVNRTISDLIGLDYDAFTRSVILPQGKFAELLAGDAAKRRDILTELLGLELFKKMAQRSNDLATDARKSADVKQELIDDLYATVDENALRVAIAYSAMTSARAKLASDIQDELGELLRRWTDEVSATQDAERCSQELAELARDFESASNTFECLAAEERGATAAHARVRRDLAAAEKAFGDARSGLENAQAAWGPVDQVAALRAQAARLTERQADLSRAEDSLAHEKEEGSRKSAHVEAAAVALAQADNATLVATRTLTDREQQHESARVHDAAGSLVLDLETGDPCPVCERPLKSIPGIDPQELIAAAKGLDEARQVARAAQEARSSAVTDHAVAVKDVEASRASAARCTDELVRTKEKVAELVELVAAGFGGNIPDRHESALNERLAELKKLAAEVDRRVDLRQEARDALARSEKAEGAIRSQVDQIRGRLEAARLSATLARIKDAAPDIEVPDVLPGALPIDAPNLAAVSAGAGVHVAALMAKLSEVADARTRARDALVDKARAAIPEDLGIQGASFDEWIESAKAAGRRAFTEKARAEEAERSMREQLEARVRYEREVVAHRKEQAVYSDLGRELRSDHVVSFLQTEALRVLASAASARLVDLSSTRYRLVYEEDRFFIVDAWNGDERRNVKTLSGGETFLASLALSLALSEQIQLLAVSERNRLDSLFLDEGFGSLDAESLEEAVAAIEQ
ncbi:MAG: SMC family ATPase, partial [Actinobacteria bacterium]|nr:SMC family ATPase [Actinomycetota bacterium]